MTLHVTQPPKKPKWRSPTGNGYVPGRLKLTLADFEYMVEQGAFTWLRDRRIELIRGEIREMMAPNPPHSLVVTNLHEWSHDSVPRNEVIIRCQNPVGIPELDSSPEPDIVWVRRRDYFKRHPRNADVLLLIEVADTTYRYDTGEKLKLYAECGIKDYWVVNIREYRVEVFRKPRRGVYTERKVFDYEAVLSPLTFPKIELAVERAFAVK
ncbi:MAG: Uma2 family endonuclease [Planctomycetaceae bacterium]|nr:Uma2 family endonuclease [Planctomycetaceae bacterium]